VLVDELLVVGDQGLGDGLTDGVDLGSVTTAGDADADVDIGELVEAEDQERLVDLWEEQMLAIVGLGCAGRVYHVLAPVVSGGGSVRSGHHGEEVDSMLSRVLARGCVVP
jgi:hypothetical protein